MPRSLLAVVVLSARLFVGVANADTNDIPECVRVPTLFFFFIV